MSDEGQNNSEISQVGNVKTNVVMEPRNGNETVHIEGTNINTEIENVESIVNAESNDTIGLKNSLSVLGNFCDAETMKCKRRYYDNTAYPMFESLISINEVVSFFAKKARGIMTKYIVDNELKDIESIKVSINNI